MDIQLRMCDPRLVGFIDHYGHWPVPMENIATFAPGLIAFNLSGAKIEVDGTPRSEPVLMGLATDPTHIHYSISGGQILTARLFPNAFDRLLHLDMTRETGVVGLDPKHHPKIAVIHERLQAAPAKPQAWFDVLDRAFLELLDDVKPIGLVGRLIDVMIASERNWTVSELAEALGCSPRTLERACRQRYGRTPQRLLRADRIRRARKLEQDGTGRIELEHDFPFADLPHYLNELRKTVGLTRTEIKDSANFGMDFSYRRLWPDGRVAETPEDEELWHAEMQRRYEAYRG